MRKTVTYFDEQGPGNTEETLKLALERALELGIRDVVVASTTGRTAYRTMEYFNPEKFNVVVVTLCRGEGQQLSEKQREGLLSKGLKIFTGTHALGEDVSSAFKDKFKGTSFNEVVRWTLYRFCQGMKVCVEIVLMAADAGLIPVDREVIALAGSDEGADTAIVVVPSYPRDFLNMKIAEIVAKPRMGKDWM